MQPKFAIFALVFSLLLAACQPSTPTPAPIPTAPPTPAPTPTDEPIVIPADIQALIAQNAAQSAGTQTAEWHLLSGTDPEPVGAAIPKPDDPTQSEFKLAAANGEFITGVSGVEVVYANDKAVGLLAHTDSGLYFENGADGQALWQPLAFSPAAEKMDTQGWDFVVDEAGNQYLIDPDDPENKLTLYNGQFLTQAEYNWKGPGATQLLGERFTYAETSHELTFISPIDGSPKPVPLTWSKDGQRLSVDVNNETMEFGADQLSVFLPYKRPADRMLVLTNETGQRIVWNEYSGQWIKDEWKTNTELTESMLVNFDPLVWARLNGDHFPYAQNSGLYGKVFSNAGPNSAFYLKINPYSTEQFWRSLKTFSWTERNGGERSVSVIQWFNVNGDYSYLLVFGETSRITNHNDLTLELGYGSAVKRNIAIGSGPNSLLEQLRDLKKKQLINDREPSKWTDACYHALFNFITSQCEQAYYMPRSSKRR